MKSRWTVLGPGTDVNTPVVPCDDAAVERVAAELCRQRGWDWANAGDEVQAALRNAAALALHAAGEMS